MSILYKYFPFRSSFFDDPLLRLTPPFDLNDPFDSKPTQSGIKKKADFFLCTEDESVKNRKKIRNLREFYETSLKQGLDDFGIVSLTQDPHNLLMWSHYADQHKGFIVSIYCDDKTFIFHNESSKSCGITTHKPIPVIYSNRRPGHEMPDQTIYEYFENQFFTHFATIKSNDWIYEKEYRYIIHHREADAAIVESSANNLPLCMGNDFRVTHLQGSTYKIEPIHTEKESYLPLALAFSQGRGEISDVKLFKRLQPKSIIGIYFGCRVTQEAINQVIKRIKSNPRFCRQISFYKSIESQDRFEINFAEIDKTDL